jgi:hypothetical protein
VATRTPDTRVRLPVLRGGCRDVAFLSWRYPSDVVASLLPDGLTVQEHDGSAWVSIVPFEMTAARLPGLPRRLGLAYAETNLRTYVTDRHGRDGLWFFSADLPNAAMAAPGRLLGAATRASSLRVDVREAEGLRRLVRYVGRRADASYDIEVGVTHERQAIDDTTVWLTGRWRAYSRGPLGLLVTTVVHEPWPLLRAEARSVCESLTAAAALPAPRDEPVVHYSPGVEQMRAAAPRRV